MCAASAARGGSGRQLITTFRDPIRPRRYIFVSPGFTEGPSYSSSSMVSAIAKSQVSVHIQPNVGAVLAMALYILFCAGREDVGIGRAVREVARFYNGQFASAVPKAAFN